MKTTDRMTSKSYLVVISRCDFTMVGSGIYDMWYLKQVVLWAGLTVYTVKKKHSDFQHILDHSINIVNMLYYKSYLYTNITHISMWLVTRNID